MIKGRSLCSDDPLSERLEDRNEPHASWKKDNVLTIPGGFLERTLPTKKVETPLTWEVKETERESLASKARAEERKKLQC